MITTPTHPEADSYVTLLEAEALLTNRSNMEGWNALNNDQKEQLLVMATSHLDTLRFFHDLHYPIAMHYRDKQALKFPRTNSRRMSGKVRTVGANYFTDTNLANRQDTPDDFFKGGAVIIYEGTGKGKTYDVTAFENATGKITVATDFSPAIDTTSYYVVIQKIPVEVKKATVEQALYILNGGGERAKLQAEGVKSYSIGDLSETFGDNGVGGSLSISQEARGFLSKLISRIGTIE